MKTFNLRNTCQDEKHKHLCLLIYFSSNGRCWHACTDTLKLSTCVQQRYMQLHWRFDAAAIFNLSLLLERFNDPFCWNFEVLFAFMQNYVLRTITYSLCISFWHLSLSLSPLSFSLLPSFTPAHIFLFFAISRYRAMYQVNLSKAQHTFYNTI